MKEKFKGALKFDFQKREKIHFAVLYILSQLFESDFVIKAVATCATFLFTRVTQHIFFMLLRL